LSYIAGAVTASCVLVIVILLALRLAGVNQPHQHAPRDGLRLGLGVALLLAGAVIAVRRRRARFAPRPSAREKQGLVSRLTATPTPRSAYVVGLLLFAPGLTFIAAIQVIATSRAGIPITALGAVIVVIINVLLAWLPLLLYLVAPGPTHRQLTAFNSWLRAHSRVLLIVVLIVAGLILVASGSYGLARGN
jgi:hypothetical protein